jgi:hypothetical protein
MFNDLGRLNYGELYRLAVQLAKDAEDLGRRIARLDAQRELMAEISDVPDVPGAPEAALDLLASMRVAIAAVYEKAEMHHAITLILRVRDAEAEQHEMETDS